MRNVKCISSDDDKFKRWYLNDKLHKDRGPAVEFFEIIDDQETWYRLWYKNGALHREDGPAMMFSDGSFLWYLDNNSVTKEDVFDYAIKNNNRQALKALLWNKY